MNERHFDKDKRYVLKPFRILEYDEEKGYRIEYSEQISNSAWSTGYIKLYRDCFNELFDEVEE